MSKKKEISNKSTSAPKRARTASSTAASSAKNTGAAGSAVPKKGGGTRAVAPLALSEDLRHRMVAEAAYFRAEARGFVPGYALEDWLAAEREIAKSLEVA